MFAKKLIRIRKGWVNLQRSDFGAKNFIATGRKENKCQALEKTFLYLFESDKFPLNNVIARKLHVSTGLCTLEIKYAHEVIQNSKLYPDSIANSQVEKKDLTFNEIQQLIDKDWQSTNCQELLETFEILSYSGQKYHDIFMNDSKYKVMLNVLSQQCENFNKVQLLKFMDCLELWPLSNNKLLFSNLLRNLDQQCINRLSSWTIDEIFLINYHYFKYNYLRKYNFPWKSLKSINISKLTSSHLVELMFLIKAHGKLKISLKEIEYHIKKYINKFTLDELGIIAMAFFRYETRINDQELLKFILNKVIDNIETVNEITLSAILKALRYSIVLNELTLFKELLQSLIKKVPGSSLQTITHIAHMQGSTLLHNEELISKILERYEKEISDARLKDIERISFVLYTFCYDPKKTLFYSNAAKDLMEPRRSEEIKTYPKSLVYTIMFMLQANYYNETAVKFIMNPKFVDQFSKGDIKNLNREYLIIHYCLELDHPEYDGPKLPYHVVEYLKKYGAFYKPMLSKNRKTDQFTKNMIDVIHTCKNLTGSESAVYTDILLPHVTRANIILCYDPEKQMYVSPKEQLHKIPLGSIKYAPKDGKKWFALLIATHNVMTRDTDCPTGILELQMRHLRCVGYNPILINHKWLSLPNEMYKKNVLSSLLRL